MREARGKFLPRIQPLRGALGRTIAADRRSCYAVRGSEYLHMIERTYRWMLGLAGSKHAELALGAVAFAEASFFPIIPELMLVPMVIARRDKAWRLAFVCTMASVAGGVFGYAIGAVLFDTVGQWVIQLYGMQDKATQFQAMYDQYGLWVILVKGLTPIPYKLVTIVSGMAHFNIWVFIAASIVTRGLRFFIVAGLLRQFGAPVQEFIERRLTLVFLVVLACIIGGFAMLKYV